MEQRINETFALLGNINESTACVAQNIGYLFEGVEKDIALADALTAASKLVSDATALLVLLATIVTSDD